MLLFILLCTKVVQKMSEYKKNRAENEVRTRDPQLGKLMLYQLSYFRILFFEGTKIMKKMIPFAKKIIFLHFCCNYFFFAAYNHENIT